MKLIKIIFIISTIAYITFFLCKKDNPSIEVEKTIKNWIGKKIVFPQKVDCISMNNEITCIPLDLTPYKILVYTDSTGCTSCKLQLYKWNVFIEEARNEMLDLVNFQFYFQPKNIEEMQLLFRRDSFKYPSHIDTDNQLNKLNDLPIDNRFQTFLLDKDNKVVFIGNPTDSPQVWNLYKKIIKRKKGTIISNTEVKSLITSLKIEKQTLDLKELKINKTTISKFSLKNTGNNPLIITNVSIACGCAVPKWAKQPILPNETTEIVVQVTPNSEGYFRKTIIVSCNIKEQKTKLIIKGVVKNS